MKDSSFTWAACLIALVIAVAVGALGAFVVMYLWNWLAPLFWAGAPILGFWQTWGVLILISIIASLFKSGKND